MRSNKIEFTKLFNIFLFILSICLLIYFCADDNNLLTLINSIPSLNKFWLILACVAMLGMWGIDACIIYIITSIVYPKKYKFKSAVKTTMIGQYFNSITPFAVAGQPMQFITMIRQGVSSGVAVSVLMQKFLMYQTTLVTISLTAITFKYGYFKDHFPAFVPLSIIGFTSQAFIVILLLLFDFNRPFTTKVINFFFNILSKIHIIKNPEQTSKSLETQLDFYLKNNKSISKNHALTLRLYILTFTQIALLFSIPLLIYKAFHNPGFPIIDMISAQAFVTMISAYTPLPGASGTSEGSFLVIFDLFFKSADIKQAMLLWRFITYYSCIVFGALFASLDSKKEKLDVNMSDLIQNGAAYHNNQ